MKSVKPGRGPSAMGVWGAVVAVVFGIFWTWMAASMGAPGIFPLFGVVFIITGIISGIYNYKNATGENRYSTFDITEEGEETDPLQRRFGGAPIEDDTRRPQGTGGAFCPYCGGATEADHTFCRHCGKKLR